MFFNLEWLKDYLETTKSGGEICKKLNEIGLEVENDLPNESVFEKIVVAEIQECENHPDSDHLHVCKVFDGKETYQIVCGAPNARKGIKVALALVGAYIPNGDFKIKKSKIRGVDSCGMMCSEREMGISNEHEGIMELPAECKIGELWVKEYKALEKMPIEISITPNRGDATSVYGIARDLSAGGFGALKKIEKAEVKETLKNSHSVEVKIDNCRYFCREIQGVNASAKTPKYILKRNAMNGCGDNGVIVNILNYIMFEYGQPMHTYDADKIGKKIIVDYAKHDTFKTLKGEEIKFDKSKILMVSDENNDLCVAGIMGGDDCKTTAEELKIVSDARFRYERGINPDLTEQMLNLATKMILEICGGQTSNIAVDGKLAENKVVDYPLALTKKLTGIEISTERTIEILQALQFEILEKNNDLLKIKVPRFRHDVEIKEDIAEELARIEGYDKIPEQPYSLAKFAKNAFENGLRTKKYLASAGLQESISLAFCDEKKAELFAEINDNLKLANPISSDLNYMRPSLLVSLLQAVKNNESNILENQLALFEEGAIFKGTSKEEQIKSIAGVYCGKANKTDHFKESRDFDIFDAKKDLYGLLENVYGVNVKSLKLEKSSKKYVHPTRSFDVKIRNKDGEQTIAVFGEISPVVLKDFEIKNPVCFFELFSNGLSIAKPKSQRYKESTIQPIVRDIAFVVDSKTNASELLSAYKDEIIKDIIVVDVYQMPIVDNKSIALRYIFEPKDEAITTEQINELMNKIIKAVETKTGGKVRDGK